MSHTRQTSLYLLILTLILLTPVSCSLIEEENPAPEPTTEASASDSGTIIITTETNPPGQTGSFAFTGVPTGTIATDSTLVVTDLTPGTYTTTQVDPAPDFDVTAVQCDDQGTGLASSGDAQTRTAVINLEANETVTCTFTNTQRGTVVIAGRTEPADTAGQLQFTGVPSGTIPANGTLVTANLPPGTYTSTQVDPAPTFDLTAVQCDDEASPTPSSGDPTTRSANFNLDAGELVTCTFVNTRRGSAVIQVEADSSNTDSSFIFTGVPSGTLPVGGQLQTQNLSPGSYTTTEVDPAPDFTLTSVTCDDATSEQPSSGDAAARTAIFNIEAGETVRCIFNHEANAQTPGGGAGEGVGNEQPPPDTGTNPFVDPGTNLPNFPLPGELPPEAGTLNVPRPGPWSVSNFAGRLDCGDTTLTLPAEPVEGGTIELVDGGATIIARGVNEAETGTITLNAVPEITGRYEGVFQAIEQGVPITIDYYWQLVTDEYIIGYLTSTFAAEGITCSLYRPFELRYAGS